MKTMSCVMAMLAGLAAGAGTVLAAAPAPAAGEILEKAEVIRNPTEDYSVQVTLIDKKKGGEERRTYETLLEGREKALVKFVQPVSEASTRVLMLGADMWVHMATTAKPIRISAKQKLTGNAAYGDVARLNFVGNYTARLAREDKLDGRDAWVLDLTSIDGRPVTYDKIEYWIDQKMFRPLKTLYMTTSGKVIREGYFEDYKNVFGVERPTKFILMNHIQKDHVTTLVFTEPKKQKFSPLVFQKQNLGRE